ncbi:MAG: aspartate aminotransferase [Legionellales bacterium]|nr:aspartate aminotransferase [Legionellales bacterium]OUX66485.1 MAG: hypothetical protein CBE41_00235 [Gammaproteobacteria bacterium TMED281]
MQTPKLSQKVMKLKPSATIAVSDLAKKLKEQGEPVISLALGEPDFLTPQFIQDAAIDAIRSGEHHYTPVGGTTTLKEAICHKFKRDNRLSYTTDQVMAGTGCKQVIFNALTAILDPGDEVVVHAPYWTSYPAMVEFCEAVPRIVECTDDAEYLMTPSQLESAINDKTKAVMINYPSNPTGACYSKAQLIAILDVLEKHPNIWVLSDEIYEHIVFDDFEFHSIAALNDRVAPRVVTFNGVSKSHAMTGWRLGYCGADSQLIKAMSKIQSQSTSNPCAVTQAAAAKALVEDHGDIKIFRDTFKSRIDFVISLLSSTELSIVKPQGAFYVFINISHYTNDAVSFCKQLLEKEKLALVPGEAFGAKGHVRLSCAASNDELKEACERLILFLKSYS